MMSQLRNHTTGRSFLLAAGVLVALFVGVASSAQAQVAQGIQIVMADGVDPVTERTDPIECDRPGWGHQKLDLSLGLRDRESDLL